MSTTAFALRAKYDDDAPFQGATVVYGALAHAFDVKAALDAGGGTIVTDDPLLVTALTNLDGGDGPLLKTVAAPKDAPLAELPEGSVGATDGLGPAPVSDEQAKAAVEGATREPLPDEVAAEHEARASDYEALTKDELYEVAVARGLDVNKSATKAGLVAALEADDDQKAR